MKKNEDYRTTVRFPQKDWEFMDGLVEDGEYCCASEVIRAAVKEFKIKHKKKK